MKIGIGWWAGVAREINRWRMVVRTLVGGVVRLMLAGFGRVCGYGVLDVTRMV